MEDISGWDIALWSVASFAAVMLLVRVMLAFRQYWVDYYRMQAEAARKRKPKKEA